MLFYFNRVSVPVDITFYQEYKEGPLLPNLTGSSVSSSPVYPQSPAPAWRGIQLPEAGRASANQKQGSGRSSILAV